MESLRRSSEANPEAHGFKKNHIADAIAKIMRYVPQEGDSIQRIGEALGVEATSLKLNLSIIPVGHLMQFDGKDVTVAHTDRSTQFPAIAANDGFYGETRLAA